jgi:hypothetical protein
MLQKAGVGSRLMATGNSTRSSEYLILDLLKGRLLFVFIVAGENNQKTSNK